MIVWDFQFEKYFLWQKSQNLSKLNRYKLIQLSYLTAIYIKYNKSKYPIIMVNKIKHQVNFLFFVTEFTPKIHWHLLKDTLHKYQT